MKIYFHYKKILFPIFSDEIVEMLIKVLRIIKKLDIPVFDIEFHFVSDSQIAWLNKRYLKRTGPTNILSFPGGEDSPGSLVLSIDSFNRECKLYDQDEYEYFLFLLLHGCGHLAGLDHGTEMDALIQMFYDELLKDDQEKK